MQQKTDLYNGMVGIVIASYYHTLGINYAKKDYRQQQQRETENKTSHL